MKMMRGEATAKAKEMTHLSGQIVCVTFMFTILLCLNQMCSKCFFNDEILNVIVHETNRYASQKLAGQVLDKRQDVTLNKIKAFPVVSVVMGVNLLPSTADYC